MGIVSLGAVRNSLVLWYKALMGERPTGYGDSLVCRGQTSVRGGQNCVGNRVAEGLAWVERQHELCQLQLKAWHLLYGDLPKKA